MRHKNVDNVSYTLKAMLAQLKRKLRSQGEEQARPQAPKTRSECRYGPRPCPFVGCRYNLFLNVTPQGGLNFPHGDSVMALARLDPSCALDVADDGPTNHLHLSYIFDLSESRIKDEMCRANKKLRLVLADQF